MERIVLVAGVSVFLPNLGRRVLFEANETVAVVEHGNICYECELNIQKID